jgi:type IV pilus assembly protein PilM
MALAFFESGARKKLDQVLAVDLGGRITKAVHLQRRGDHFILCRYALIDAPIFDKSLSADLLKEHLMALSMSFEGKVRHVALTVGVNDAVVRHVEMPPMPADDVRAVLKHNSRVYLQQDLSGYVFDCYAAPQQGGRLAKTEPAKGFRGKGDGHKQTVLIAGAKRQLVDDYVSATKGAGLMPDHIVPGVIGPVNAFEKAMPEVFSKDVVALVDIGFKSSSISILQEGQLILSRVVGIGGDRLTTGLAETMNISYAEAEGIKIGMASEVQSVLESLLTPLGRELRASIDFFEHQQDRTVTSVFLSGGSARSEFIAQILRHELMVECKTWNPAAFLKTTLQPEQAAELEHVAPQLTVAIGAALTAL